jgi:hypothetical protein
MGAKITASDAKKTQAMPTDNDTVTKAMKAMNECALAIAKMTSDLADARTVKEFSSDRVKRAFSVEVERFLTAGDSATASEHKARASAQYGSSLHDLGEQYKTAMRTIEQHEGLKVRFESARSILSTEKAKMGLL